MCCVQGYCYGENIEVWDGATAVGRYCGSYQPDPVYISSGNRLSIRVSQYLDKGTDFRLLYSFVPFNSAQHVRFAPAPLPPSAVVPLHDGV